MSPGQVCMYVLYINNVESMYMCLLCCEGDFYADPTLLLPAMADKKNLAKVYDAVSVN